MTGNVRIMWVFIFIPKRPLHFRVWYSNTSSRRNRTLCRADRKQASDSDCKEGDCFSIKTAEKTKQNKNTCTTDGVFGGYVGCPLLGMAVAWFQFPGRQRMVIFLLGVKKKSRKFLDLPE